MINLLLLLVYLLIWLFFQLEPVGTSWNHLDPAGIWLDLVPVEPTGNSLLTGIQMENLEGVPCLFGRYPTQKILVGIRLVPTSSGWNLWGTVKTSILETHIWQAVEPDLLFVA